MFMSPFWRQKDRIESPTCQAFDRSPFGKSDRPRSETSKTRDCAEDRATTESIKEAHSFRALIAVIFLWDAPLAQGATKCRTGAVRGARSYCWRLKVWT